MPKFTHLLFDCDNTLVLSEELAFEACADVLNSVLAEKGKPERFTKDELITKFVGMNFRGMLEALAADETVEKEKRPTFTEKELADNVIKEKNQVIAKLRQSAEPCVNCNPVLEELAQEKKYSLAVVSSSAKDRVIAALEKVDQKKHFPDNVIFSAVDVGNSKPKPDVYIHACKVLGAKPEESIAVEDSKNGTISAVDAGIPVIGYVGSYHGAELQEEMRQLLLHHGAKVVMSDWTEFKSKVAELENGGKL